MIAPQSFYVDLAFSEGALPLDQGCLVDQEAWLTYQGSRRRPTESVQDLSFQTGKDGSRGITAIKAVEHLFAFAYLSHLYVRKNLLTLHDIICCLNVQWDSIQCSLANSRLNIKCPTSLRYVMLGHDLEKNDIHPIK